MRKTRILFGMLLCAFIFASCGKNESARASLLPEDSPSAIPSVSGPDGGLPEPAGAAPPSDTAYFILGGRLAGALENGAWKSFNDTDGRYETEYSDPFYFGEVLSCPRFALYSKNGKIGYSDFALVNGGEGVGGFDDGDQTGLFAPYAKPDSGGLWPYFMEIGLPAVFGPEMDGIKIPDYGYALRFSYDNIDLATNSSLDINPYGKAEWNPYFQTDGDHGALGEVLEENHISAETHFDDLAAADVDGDGERETLLFANTPRDENGYPKISPADGGSYSVILLRRPDGRYETVYGRYLEKASGMNACFYLRPLGVFDLNGDGRDEICADMVEWESGFTFVLSPDENGEWKTVLRADWGM